MKVLPRNANSSASSIFWRALEFAFSDRSRLVVPRLGDADGSGVMPNGPPKLPAVNRDRAPLPYGTGCSMGRPGGAGAGWPDGGTGGIPNGLLAAAMFPSPHRFHEPTINNCPT